MTKKKSKAKKKTQGGVTGKPVSPLKDSTAYRVITFSFYDHTGLHIDTALDDGTLTDFLITVNRDFSNPSIVSWFEVSESQYRELEQALETTEELEQAANEPEWPEEREIELPEYRGGESGDRSLASDVGTLEDID